MSDESGIPVLTDVIEKGDEIRMSDLGLDDELQVPAEIPLGDDQDLEIEVPDAVDPLAAHPALEQTIRRILDEHLELAWQEIRLEIKKALQKP